MAAVLLDEVLAALADPTRRAVLDRLRAGPRPGAAVAAGLPVSRPAVSQHLKRLLDAGLVRSRPAGRQRLYEVDPGGLAGLRSWVEGWWTGVLAAFAAEVETEVRDGG
jgi:DNA-binding transcriptional ArsR family regulator